MDPNQKANEIHIFYSVFLGDLVQQFDCLVCCKWTAYFEESNIHSWSKESVLIFMCGKKNDKEKKPLKC